MKLPWLSLLVMVAIAVTALPCTAQSASSLPMSLRFKGKDKFNALVARAKRENWVALPLGERTIAVALALKGTPYKSYTLEIDDKIEATSVNFDGLDCWTFFETAVGFARMLKECQLEGKEPTPEDLLAQIESDRYRGGVCTGEYLSRLHFLEEWYDDNQKRGLVVNVTKELGGVPMGRRNVSDMSKMWKSYRYLKNNPDLLPKLREIEKANSALNVLYIPRSKLKTVQDNLKPGDVICITTDWKGSYTSHVGLAYRDRNGKIRFMHATSSKRKGYQVIIDGPPSQYLYENKYSGIYVVRPKESLKVQTAARAAAAKPPAKAIPVDLGGTQ